MPEARRAESNLWATACRLLLGNLCGPQALRTPSPGADAALLEADAQPNSRVLRNRACSLMSTDE